MTRQSILDRSVPTTILRWEGGLVCLGAWICFVSAALLAGGMGLTWDAINHHIYLGWTAQHQRFDRDFLAAGYQSFQAPYLYWPVYRMAADGWGGTATAFALATLHLLVVWPVWMLARCCIPGVHLYAFILRQLAVTLALLSGVVLSAFGTSTNDVLAAAPLVWALAWALEPVSRGTTVSEPSARRQVLLSGIGSGLAVGLKLSNGPLAVLMPGLWLLAGQGVRSRLAAVAIGSVGGLVAVVIAYGPWGWLLWHEFGNPVFPFQHEFFAPVRSWLGWRG